VEPGHAETEDYRIQPSCEPEKVQLEVQGAARKSDQRSGTLIVVEPHSCGHAPPSPGYSFPFTMPEQTMLVGDRHAKRSVKLDHIDPVCENVGTF
jgi:hypothetical protein